MHKLRTLGTSPVMYLEMVHGAVHYPFGVYMKNQKLLMIVTLVLIFNSFQYAFKYIFSRASSFYLLVHFIHKSSSSTRSIPLNVLDNFNFMKSFLLIFYSFYFPSRVLLLLYSYFVDYVHLHNFAYEKNIT